LTNNDEPKPVVLVVDDVASNAYILNVILGEEYKVFTASSGSEAMRLANQHMPDIILLDIDMPEMNGFDVCAKIKADHATAHIPVIFITGYGDVGSEIKALEAGGVDFIAKPPIAALVRARLHTHLSIKKQADLLRRLSNLDSLTSVANRRHFFELAEREFSRIRRYNREMSIIMLDIDNFKNINDSNGHATGDKVIIALVQLASTKLRHLDAIGRLGGEEFAILMPETAIKEAMIVAERLRKSIETEMSSDVPSITISMGVSSVIAEDKSFETALARADAALYQAKNEGRNTVRQG
jgi:diguanylate cyclase (GGDEF)-like protein